MNAFNPDWFAASYEGGRDVRWYIARAAEGDIAAASRALELIAASTTPRAIAQNGGSLTPDVLAFLLSAAAAQLTPKSKGKAGAKRNPYVAMRDWWLCVEMRRHFIAAEARGERSSFADAAAAAARLVLPDGTHGPDEKDLAKSYRAWLPALDRFLQDQQPAAGE